MTQPKRLIPSFQEQIAAHRSPPRSAEIAKQLGDMRLPELEKGKARARPRHTPGKMNSTERAFADELDLRKRVGEVLAWEFEAVKFKLADKCWFCCDFMLHLADGSIQFVDVKGWKAEDDATVKIKCAAERFKMFQFAFATKTKTGWVWRPF